MLQMKFMLIGKTGLDSPHSLGYTTFNELLKVRHLAGWRPCLVKVLSYATTSTSQQDFHLSSQVRTQGVLWLSLP
jgi:hypothetical protein